MVQIISTPITEGDRHMKKLMLAASLCVAAFVVAPIASASASFTGTCTGIKGTANFEPNLTKELKAGIGYSFEDKKEGTCKASGGNEYKIVEAKVTGGKFEGSCAVATSTTDGKGTLELEAEGGSKKTLAFDLDFTAAGGNVALELEPAGGAGGDTATATGAASFLNSKNQTPKECTEGLGVSHLEFEAHAAGTIG
jgi:hypothetical protein